MKRLYAMLISFACLAASSCRNQDEVRKNPVALNQEASANGGDGESNQVGLVDYYFIEDISEFVYLVEPPDENDLSLVRNGNKGKNDPAASGKNKIDSGTTTTANTDSTNPNATTNSTATPTTTQTAPATSANQTTAKNKLTGIFKKAIGRKTAASIPTKHDEGGAAAAVVTAVAFVAEGPPPPQGAVLQRTVRRQGGLSNLLITGDDNGVTTAIGVPPAALVAAGAASASKQTQPPIDNRDLAGIEDQVAAEALLSQAAATVLTARERIQEGIVRA